MTLNRDNTATGGVSASDDKAAPRPALSPVTDPDNTARLAHEMANLLDGALRNLGLALRALQDGNLQDLQQARDQVPRLGAAHQAMRQMATLVQHLVRRRAASTALQTHQSLEQIVQQAVRLLTPAAQVRQIEINMRLEPAVASLPAGPLYPVIANALRNSIEAISLQPQTGGVAGIIDIAAFFDEDHVMLLVRDDGPGLDPRLTDESGEFVFGVTTKTAGNGLGLGLCRQIAENLKGQLTVRTRPTRGTELLLRFPVSSLLEESEQPH